LGAKLAALKNFYGWVARVAIVCIHVHPGIVIRRKVSPVIGALLPSPAVAPASTFLVLDETTTFPVLDAATAKCLTRQMHGFHGQAPRWTPAGKRMIRTMGFLGAL
jgi:hypothetical protein